MEASDGTAPRSDLRHASIDSEIHTGDVRTFIRGEEHDCCRNFFGFTSAAEWNLRDELVSRLLGLLRSEACILKCWSLDWSGAYRVHADFAVFQFHGPAPREAAHSRLARGVDGKRWHSHYVRH